MENDRGIDNRGDDRKDSRADSREDNRGTNGRGRDEGRRNAENPEPGQTLFVSGVSKNVNEKELTEHFAPFGHIERLVIMYDPHSREHRGFGFVTYENVEQAQAAKDGCQGKSVAGKTFDIHFAKRNRPRTPTGKWEGPPRRRNDRDRSPPRRYRRDSPRRRDYSPRRSPRRDYSPRRSSPRRYSPRR